MSVSFSTFLPLKSTQRMSKRFVFKYEIEPCGFQISNPKANFCFWKVSKSTCCIIFNFCSSKFLIRSLVFKNGLRGVLEICTSDKHRGGIVRATRVYHARAKILEGARLNARARVWFVDSKVPVNSYKYILPYR